MPFTWRASAQRSPRDLSRNLPIVATFVESYGSPEDVGVRELASPMSMSERAATMATRSGNGWLVVVTMRRLRGIGSDDQLLFAAALADPANAERSVQKALGGLHCTIEARIRMTPKALARLNVPLGKVKHLPSY